MAIVMLGEENLDKDTGLLFVNQTHISETAPLHTHDFYEFFIVTKGSALHLINNSVQTIYKGDLFFIRPNDTHCYDFYHSEDFGIINIGFSKHIFQNISHFFDNTKKMNPLIEDSLPKCIHLIKHDFESVIEEFLRIGDWDQFSTRRQVTYHAQSYFSLLFSDFFFEYKHLSENSTSLPDWLNTVLLEMSKIENLQEGFSKMLSLSHCSKNHLCRILKSNLGLTPTQYINEQRLNYSIYLLIQTSLDILTICEMCGFNNLSHFYHLFKLKFFCSPGKFRKSSNSL